MKSTSYTAASAFSYTCVINQPMECSSVEYCIDEPSRKARIC